LIIVLEYALSYLIKYINYKVYLSGMRLYILFDVAYVNSILQ